MAPRIPLLLAALLVFAFPARAVSPPPVEAPHGMVVTSQHLATAVGVAVLQAGGNAVDAAVAIGYAQAVVNPCCGNVGGGGFLTLHLAPTATSPPRDRFLNFRETAPAAATPTMFLDPAGNPVPGASLYGWRAVAVPGTVLGLDTVLARYGTLPRAQVMAPAIALARDGFVLTRGDTDILAAGTRRFAENPALAAIFLRPDHTPFQPGDRLVQTDLANTLQSISDAGPGAFYRGAFPQTAATAAAAANGILAAADFAAYTVTESDPVRCTYRGLDVLSAPPPSSGGVTLCEILNILSGYDMRALGLNSAAATHLTVEAMRHAFLDRNTYLGDPAFVQNPLDRLLSPTYAAAIRATIPPGRATPSGDFRPGTPPHEKTETTHYSVLDAAGNAVSVTYTINGFFGAYAMPPGTGVLMNDEMDDFTIKPGTPNLFGLVQGAANSIQPGKRPLSSMAPTVVLQDGKPLLVLGSPGGSRIITITLETLMNIVDYGLGPQEAVDAPRFHHQWLPDQLYAEPGAFSADTRTLLEAMGYTITTQTPWGAAELIQSAPYAVPNTPAATSSGNDSTRTAPLRPGLLYGANDNRRPAGAAAGY